MLELTRLQRQVLELDKKGLTAEKAAEELFIFEKSYKKILRKAQEKSGILKRYDFIRFYYMYRKGTLGIERAEIKSDEGMLKVKLLFDQVIVESYLNEMTFTNTASGNYIIVKDIDCIEVKKSYDNRNRVILKFEDANGKDSGMEIAVYLTRDSKLR